MKYLVTGKEMQLLDKNTSEHFGVPTAVLMEQAAMVFVRELLLSVPNIKKVLVVSGLGNNGADGIAIARLLNQKKIHTELYTMQERLPEKTGSELFELQKKIYRNYRYPELSAEKLQAILSRDTSGKTATSCLACDYDCIIDAVFGIGLSRNISGIYEETIGWMNRLPGVKVAVDIASGISADTGAVLGCAARCDHTITFSFGKTGMYLWPGTDYSGEVHVVPMGITEESLPEKGRFQYFSLERSDLQALMPKRFAHSNKGTYGKLLVIAGGPGMAGACVFSAKAAYRTGTGLVSVFTHEINRQVVQSLIPEAVLHTWNEEMGEEELQQKVQKLLSQATAIVIGPGLTTSEYAALLVKTVLSQAKIPVILDADALNILARHSEYAGSWNTAYPQAREATSVTSLPDTFTDDAFKIEESPRIPCIITPHLGEMSRLTGRKINELQQNLVAEAEKYAREKQCICVLKDFHTITADPSGKKWINLSGNHGMATGGSGDVLSGIIGGLLAQGLTPEIAAPLGVYLHGSAGDAIALEKGCRSMMASDIIDGITLASQSF